MAILAAAGQHRQAQEGIVIAIYDEAIRCGAEEAIYFTDDNSGRTDFKTLIRIRTTPSVPR